MYVGVEIYIGLGETIVALFKANRSDICKRDLLIHYVVDVGLELPLVFEIRDFSCKENFAEHVFERKQFIRWCTDLLLHNSV